MKVVLIYPDPLSEIQKNRIRREWESGKAKDLIILDGGPQLIQIHEDDTLEIVELRTSVLEEDRWVPE